MKVCWGMAAPVPAELERLLQTRGHACRVGTPDDSGFDVVLLEGAQATAPGVLRVLWARGVVAVELASGVDAVLDAGAPHTWTGRLEALEVRVLHARQQQRLREDGLLRWAPDATLLVAEDGRVVRANAAAERMFGVAAGGWDGRTVDSLLPERFRAGHAGQRARYRDDPAVRSMGKAAELAAVDSTGREFPVEICLTPMVSPEGAFTVASLRDVTERKQMEAAVRAGEAALLGAAAVQREILDTLPAHVCLLDGEGNVMATNAAWQNYGRENGYSQGMGEGLGRNYLEVCDATRGAEAVEAREVAQGIRSVLAGEVESFHARYACHSPGNPRWFRVVVEPTRSRRGAVVTHVEITHFELAQQALHRSRLEMQRLVECVPEPMAVLKGRTVVFANAAWALALLREDHECLGRPVTDLVLPEDRGALDRMLAAAGSAPAELRFGRSDGQVVVLEMLPLVDVEWDGAPARLLVARDLSEQKRMRSQLLLADRMVSVGTLAAGVAHEINNPLAVVTANLSLARDELTRLKETLLEQEDEAAHLAVEPVLTALQELEDGAVAAERVRRIVRDLRTMTRGEDEQVGPVHLEGVLGSAITMTQNEIRHRARIQTRFEAVPPVVGNEARLGQVFINLLVNAAQAIPEGHAQHNEIAITLTTREGLVVVDVTDTGQGMTPEQMQRIFDPFFTTKPVGVGTGLGLSICDGIVRGLGGFISVQSKPLQGSQFSVWLKPAVDVPPTPVPVAQSHQAGVRGRVLVIDDDPGIIRIMNRFLAKEHEVVSLMNALQAVERLRAGEEFDLILCDVMMPEMDARQFHAEVAQHAPRHLDRIVFVTGGAFSPAAQEFLAGVPNPRLEKPFDRTQLLQLVEQALREVRR